MRRARGITLVTVLMFLAIASGFYLVVAFGQAYWDNMEVGSVLRQAANECYRQPDDVIVRQFIMRRLHELFDVEGVDRVGRRETRMRIQFDPEDIQIQRNEVPKYVNIWLTYRRNVMLPLVGSERTLTFTDHAQQDLSPVKW